MQPLSELWLRLCTCWSTTEGYVWCRRVRCATHGYALSVCFLNVTWLRQWGSRKLYILICMGSAATWVLYFASWHFNLVSYDVLKRHVWMKISSSTSRSRSYTDIVWRKAEWRDKGLPVTIATSNIMTDSWNITLAKESRLPVYIRAQVTYAKRANPIRIDCGNSVHAECSIFLRDLLPPDKFFNQTHMHPLEVKHNSPRDK